MNLKADTTRLNSLLRMFYRSTGIGIGIYTPEDELIALYPKEYGPICRLMRNTDKTKVYCEQCDKEAFERCRENHELQIYTCHAGLTEVFSPLMDNVGNIFGYISFGQLPCHENPDIVRSVLENTLKKYNFPPDPERIEEFINYAPYKSYAQLISMAGIMEICANHIIQQGIVLPNKSQFRNFVEIYVENHLAQKISTKKLCKELAMSRSLFFDEVKKEFGIPFTHYVNKRRLAFAKELLITSDSSISDIAIKTGFSSSNYFCKVFQKGYGISPHQYRLSYKRPRSDAFSKKRSKLSKNGSVAK